MSTTTSKDVAEKLTAYLHQKIELKDLVDWAEDIIQEGDFEEDNYDTIREVVGRLGVSDVKAFGLTWDDCRNFLNQLGYDVRVEVNAH